METLNAPELISLLLTALYLFVVATFIRGWNVLPSFRSSKPVARTSVSIIIAARDEAQNIAKTIEDLLAQDYPAPLTEIIFIDDHSEDNTAAIIRSYPRLKLIQLNEADQINSYKKKAIETAIGQASGDLIITTDADCRMSPQWLSTVVDYYEQNNYKMISSPVCYTDEKSWFERAQSLEFLYLIGMGASTIGNRQPSTCNGANLAYQKSVFHEVGGFKGIDDLASGDDELLLHKIAERYPAQIGFCKNYQAMVFTEAKPTLSAFIQQRKRWASKSTRYKNKAVIVLGVLVWLFNFSILANLLLTFISTHFLVVAALQLLLKIAVEFAFLNQVTRFARRKELLQLVPALSILHIFYILYIGIAGNSGKYNWKGRMVK